jgi:hypothetical protein
MRSTADIRNRRTAIKKQIAQAVLAMERVTQKNASA